MSLIITINQSWTRSRQSKSLMDCERVAKGILKRNDSIEPVAKESKLKYLYYIIFYYCHCCLLLK